MGVNKTNFTHLPCKRMIFRQQRTPW